MFLFEAVIWGIKKIQRSTCFCTFFFLHQIFQQQGNNFILTSKMGVLSVAQGTALSKETNSEMRILKISPSENSPGHAIGFYSQKSISSTNCPCGSNIGRRLYITSSPYREKDKCYGKALCLLIILGIPCLQYFIKKVFSCC